MDELGWKDLRGIKKFYPIFDAIADSNPEQTCIRAVNGKERAINLDLDKVVPTEIFQAATENFLGHMAGNAFHPTAFILAFRNMDYEDVDGPGTLRDVLRK